MNSARAVPASFRNAERNASSVMSRPIRVSMLRWAMSRRLSWQIYASAEPKGRTTGATALKILEVSDLRNGSQVGLGGSTANRPCTGIDTLSIREHLALLNRQIVIW